MDEIRALRGYIHQLAVADIHGQSNLHLLTALGANLTHSSTACVDAVSSSYRTFLNIQPDEDTMYPLTWAPFHLQPLAQCTCPWNNQTGSFDNVTPPTIWCVGVLRG
eukprot:12287260-Karenia_brevis.AAC.1